jgi:ERCC4-type nuclease
LTGWKIDIKSESRMEKISSEIIEGFRNLPNVGEVASRLLYNEGFRSLKEISEIDPEELARVLGIEKEKAVEVVESALQMMRGKETSEGGEGRMPSPPDPAQDPVERIEGVGEKIAETLKGNRFLTVQDILKSNVEGLSSLPGIGVKKAEKLIESARHYIGNPNGERAALEEKGNGED